MYNVAMLNVSYLNAVLILFVSYVITDAAVLSASRIVFGQPLVIGKVFTDHQQRHFNRFALWSTVKPPFPFRSR